MKTLSDFAFILRFFRKALTLSIMFCLLLCNQSIAQKLLDPVGPISIVVASSAGSNTSLAIAYSIRQLKTTYDHPATITAPSPVSGFSNSTTPLLRVRRSSDNAQLDIGYDGDGNLDTVVLKSFVSTNGLNPAASGFVTVWYDQSGNSRDAYQTNSGQQPRIVNTGVVERNPGGQTGFAGVNGGMLEHQTSAGNPLNNPSGINIYGIDADRTMNVVSQPRAFANGGPSDGNGTYLIDRNGSTGNQDAPLTCLKAINNNWSVQIRNISSDISSSFEGSVAISTNRSDNVILMRSGNDYSMYVNGVFGGTRELIGENRMTPVRIGYGTNTGENVYYGEFILFPSALSSNDLNTLNISQGDYYVLGPPPNTWTGASSNAWATASNWTNATVPDNLASITIPSGTPNSPIISTAVTIKKITIASSATLTNNNTFNISDSLIVDGTLAGSGTVIMNGGIRQVISGATSPIVFNNLTINNTLNQVVANNNITVTGTLTVNADAIFAPVATSIINNGGPAGIITGTGSIRVTRIAATADYQNQYRFSTNTLTNLTVDYAGLGNQNINLTTNHGNVSVSGSGNKTISAAVTATNVTGNISVTAATLDNGGFAIAGNAARVFSVSNDATFRLSGTSSTYPTVFGTFTYGASSNVEYSGTASQTIANANYGNLVSSSTGTRTLGTTINIAGSFTRGTNTYTITGSTISYNGIGAQTIAAFNYNSLTIATARLSTPTITLESGTINVAGTMSITATGVGSYVITGNTVNYSGAAQTVANAFSYNNLTLRGSGVKTTTTVTVNGIMSLEGTASL